VLYHLSYGPLFFGALLPHFIQTTEWPGAESNRRHHDFQSCALPTELPGQKNRPSHRARTEIWLASDSRRPLSPLHPRTREGFETETAGFFLQ